MVTGVAALGGPLRGKGLLSRVGRVPVSDGEIKNKNFCDNLDEKVFATQLDRKRSMLPLRVQKSGKWKKKRGS